MMGAGKSAVGRQLALASGREFRDTDIILRNRVGRAIPSFFAHYGEDAFRGHETAVLRSLEPGSYVLATGGGIVLREENWVQMRRLGTVIYLRADRETLANRLRESKKVRPLLSSDDWEDKMNVILNQRISLYEQADIQVDVDGLKVEDVAAKVLKVLQG